MLRYNLLSFYHMMKTMKFPAEIFNFIFKNYVIGFNDFLSNSMLFHIYYTACVEIIKINNFNLKIIHIFI